MFETILGMLKSHCPVCKGRVACADMNRCPLVLARWKGEILTPDQFARSLGDTVIAPALISVPSPVQSDQQQFDLF